ncbi:MAG TPA: adenylate/guanylate cyclase domain-containing protein [Alphaproteobacteria bacterium]|nr:adenylate/guanylate cyclase domain-containing protein [Alphaproteobacteria bacterium]
MSILESAGGWSVPDAASPMAPRPPLMASPERLLVLIAGLLMSLLVGYIDLATDELQLTVVYVAIVSLATWASRRSWGLAFSAIELVIIAAANVPEAHTLRNFAFYAIDIFGNALVFAFCVIATDQMRLRLEEARMQKANLSRYLPAKVADLLAQEGLRAVRPGRHPAVAMFIDIRGFTARTHDLNPELVFDFLRSFRHVVADIVAVHGGVVDKFIGDGMLVVFGVPKPTPSDAARALGCGLALLSGLAAWNASRVARGEFEVEISIGVHYGEVVAGALGDESRLEYTVLGDTVNLASRIEGLTRELGIPLLVSAAALEAAEAAGFPGADWKRITVPGVKGVPEPLVLAHPGRYRAAPGSS